MVKMRVHKGLVGICFMLWSAALPSISSAQKKPFDASAIVPPDLLNGPSSTGKAHLNSVILDKSVLDPWLRKPMSTPARSAGDCSEWVTAG